MSILFTFISVHHTLKAERILQTAGVRLDIIPTPRSITTSCGMSIVLNAADAEEAEDEMLKAGVQIAGRYQQCGSDLYIQWNGGEQA
jgi:hypothetical protein